MLDCFLLHSSRPVILSPNISSTGSRTRVQKKVSRSLNFQGKEELYINAGNRQINDFTITSLRVLVSVSQFCRDPSLFFSGFINLFLYKFIYSLCGESDNPSRYPCPEWKNNPGSQLIYIPLTAIGLTPGGSSTVHIYTKTVHRTTQ